jgi:hypothetical protein
MSSYTANIPQPADDPTQSQNQILENFQSLNTIYGSSGDHYPWTNTTSAEGSRHAKVTLPGLPTTNAPGNAVPTPGNNELVIFAVTSGGETKPFYRRDTMTVNAPLAPIIAFARATASGSPLAASFIGQPFNINAVSVTGNSVNSIWDFTFSNPEADALYACLGSPISSTASSGLTFSSLSATGFSVTATQLTNLTVVILRYTL